MKELAKNVPNMAGVDDRMSRTLLVRRADVLKLPLSDILTKYPAFKYDVQVSNQLFLNQLLHWFFVLVIITPQ